MELIDYVKDAELKDGSIFNGLKIRVVGNDVLYDFAATNPMAMMILDPDNISGIAEDEILVDGKYLDKVTVNHELNEYRELKDDPGLSYWGAHTALMKLANTSQNLSMEAIVMKAKTEMIRKSMPIIVRKNPQGQDEILITTPNFDRGKDRIFPEGGVLDNYNKNPVIMWIHDYKGSTPSAGLPVAKNSYLKVTPEGIVAGPPIFLEGDEFASRVKNAWDKGFLNTASIGFAPIECETNEEGGTDYKKWEMLEWSFAPIPMNAEAARIAKSNGLDDLVEKEIVTKPEVTDDLVRVPVPSEEGKHKDCKIRTISISEKEGIQALYCVDHKTNITYLFDKDKWDMKKAEAWVKEHSKAFSQAELRDQIDYLGCMIANVGISSENIIELRRLAGGDMPVDITDPMGILIKQILGK